MQSNRSFRDFSMLIALVIICAFFAVMSPQFLGARNLSLLMTELSITATLALGMLLIILPVFMKKSRVFSTFRAGNRS